MVKNKVKAKHEMSVEVAIHQIALDAISRSAEAFCENGWENYPEIGEDDWLKVLAEIEEIRPKVHPADYRAAMTLLEGRASLTDGQTSHE